MTEPEPPPRVAWPDVCARRLDRHGLGATTYAEPADAVAAMCGAHAQVLSAAELSIGMRLAVATRSDVRQALWTEHSLVKTFGPRGTVHLLPARDLAMWTGALSAVPAPRSPFPDDVAMTPEQTDQVIEAVDDALADAELTVDELTVAVVERAGTWAGDLVMPAFQTMWPRWRQAVGTAASRGALCFGANRGRNVTYTSPRRWQPGFTPADGAASVAELVRRYLHAYGPATPAHFAQWLNTSRSWTGELFASMSGQLDRVELDGAVGWVPSGDAAVTADPPRGVQVASLLRRVRCRQPPSCAAVPGPGGEPRAVTQRPGGQLPGAAGRRRGRWGLARAPIRSPARDHGGAVRRAVGGTAPRARRAGGHGRSRTRRRAHADDRHRHRRRARLDRHPRRTDLVPSGWLRQPRRHDIRPRRTDLVRSGWFRQPRRHDIRPRRTDLVRRVVRQPPARHPSAPDRSRAIRVAAAPLPARHSCPRPARVCCGPSRPRP